MSIPKELLGGGESVVFHLQDLSLGLESQLVSLAVREKTAVNNAECQQCWFKLVRSSSDLTVVTLGT